MNLSKIKSIISLDIKLIKRNNRVKAAIGVSFLVLIYIFLIFSIEQMFANLLVDNITSPFYFSFFCYLLSLPMLAYGQLTLTWESSYSNLIFTINFKENDFIISKYYIMVILSLFTSLLCVGIFYFMQYNYLMYFLVLCSFMLNIGFNAYIYLLFSKFNYKFANLYKNSFANYDLYNFYQILSVLLCMISSYLLYFILFHFFDNYQIVFLILILVGFTGVLFHKKILKRIYAQILISKYNLLETYSAEDE